MLTTRSAERVLISQRNVGKITIRFRFRVNRQRNVTRGRWKNEKFKCHHEVFAVSFFSFCRCRNGQTDGRDRGGGGAVVGSVVLRIAGRQKWRFRTPSRAWRSDWGSEAGSDFVWIHGRKRTGSESVECRRPESKTNRGQQIEVITIISIS